METINNIELVDQSVYPDGTVLRKVLGKSYDAYCKLLKLYEDNGLEYEWRYYRDGKVWLCKVRKKNRTIVWMSAWRGYVQATVYFPEKYLDGIYRLDLSVETIDRFRNTKSVGKSKPCIFEVRNSAVLSDFVKVMQFKMAAK